jgi:hypothetical protein
LQNGGTQGRSVEFERSFEVALGTEPAGKVLSRFRTEALNHIFSTGGIVHGNGQVVPGDAQLRDFHYRYRWANNQRPDPRVFGENSHEPASGDRVLL